MHLQAEDSTGSIAPGVAAPGTAYPVEIAGSGDRTGTPTLSEFGGNQPIAAPPSPLDLDQDGA